MKINNERPILVLSTDGDKSFVEMHGIANKETTAPSMGGRTTFPELALVNVLRKALGSGQTIVCHGDYSHTRQFVLCDPDCYALFAIEAISKSMHHSISDNSIEGKPKSPGRYHKRERLRNRHQAEFNSVICVISLKISQIVLQKKEAVKWTVYGLEDGAADGSSDITSGLALRKEILQVTIEPNIGVFENAR